MKQLKLPADLYAQITTDARKDPELEICGLLGGHGAQCTAAYPIKNVSPTPRTTFYMDPQEQIDAMNVMQRDGESFIGIYHSHPRTAALPSARDTAGAAYPGLAYVILSLQDKQRPAIAAFDLCDGEFVPIELAIVSDDWIR